MKKKRHVWENLIVVLAMIVSLICIIYISQEQQFKIIKEGEEVDEIVFCKNEGQGCVYPKNEITIDWLKANCEILEQECELIFKPRTETRSNISAGTYEGFIKIENGIAYYCPKNEFCFEEECKITKYQCGGYIVEISR